MAKKDHLGKDPCEKALNEQSRCSAVQGWWWAQDTSVLSGLLLFLYSNLLFQPEATSSSLRESGSRSRHMVQFPPKSLTVGC